MTCGGQRSDLNSLFATLTCQKPDFDNNFIFGPQQWQCNDWFCVVLGSRKFAEIRKQGWHVFRKSAIHDWKDKKNRKGHEIKTKLKPKIPMKVCTFLYQSLFGGLFFTAFRQQNLVVPCAGRTLGTEGGVACVRRGLHVSDGFMNLMYTHGYFHVLLYKNMIGTKLCKIVTGFVLCKVQGYFCSSYP